MPTPPKGPRVGGGPAHERLILSNLATALFEHDQITTTAAKAKRLRPLAERLITFAKRGDLHSRRRVLTVVRDKGVVHRLFAEVAPDMAAREGGYTRITKIAPRKGDNAPMAVIELVREPLSPKKATVKEAEAAAKRAAKDATTADQPAVAAETAEVEATETTEVIEAGEMETGDLGGVPEAVPEAVREGVSEQVPEQVPEVTDATEGSESTEATGSADTTDKEDSSS